VENVYGRVDLFAEIAPFVKELYKFGVKESLIAAACVYAARKGSGLNPVWP